MLTQEHVEHIENNLLLEQIYPHKKILFFDIETNGLSSKYHDIYMIGIGYAIDQNNNYRILQWFNNDGKSEMSIIKEFLDVLKNFDVLVHYNGDSFDIPFINEKCIKYQLNLDSNAFQSLDLYKLIKHLKKFLRIMNMKQKSIENFLHIQRQDQHGGGELIQIYNDYLSNKCNSQSLESLLFLHNHDDVCGLIAIPDIISYLNLTECALKVSQFEFISENELLIVCNFECTVPIPLSLNYDGYFIKIEKNIIKFLLPIYRGELKHYYENYKDYYYLNDEDYAIHKSIALFVDKNHREKCNKDNCYIKKTSSYLKQYTAIFSPNFKKNRIDTTSYFECNNINLETLFETKEFRNYLSSLLKNIIEK